MCIGIDIASPLRIQSLNTSFEESGHDQHGFFLHLHQTNCSDGNAERPEYTVYGLHETL